MPRLHVVQNGGARKQQRLAQFHRLKRTGVHFNAHLYGRRDVRNPVLYASLVTLLGLDQHGSLFVASPPPPLPPPQPPTLSPSDHPADNDPIPGAPVPQHLTPTGWYAHTPARREQLDTKDLLYQAHQAEEARSIRRQARRQDAEGGPVGSNIEFVPAASSSSLQDQPVLGSTTSFPRSHHGHPCESAAIRTLERSSTSPLSSQSTSTSHTYPSSLSHRHRHNRIRHDRHSHHRRRRHRRRRSHSP